MAENYDVFNDDLEVIEIIEHGFPRQIYERANYIDSLDNLSFYKRFRITKETTLEVLEQIENRLEFPYNRNRSVSPINQLLITLRYYATGSHLLSVGDYSGVHVSTACRIVKRVSDAISQLCPQYIKMPTTREETMQIQRDFFDIASFPRVVGALDGTHIKIQSPGGDDAEIFRNRKGYFSINVQAVGDANLKFRNIVARWPGSTHDVTMFNGSQLRRQFENGLYQNSILLGDSGYSIRTYLLTPLMNPVARSEQLYNESHIRTRNIVERLFGVWKRRFPVLAYGCRLKIETVSSVIVATAVLHNIARDMGEDEPPVLDDLDMHELDNLIQNGQVPPIPLAAAVGAQGVGIRNNFVQNYFNNL